MSSTRTIKAVCDFHFELEHLLDGITTAGGYICGKLIDYVVKNEKPSYGISDISVVSNNVSFIWDLMKTMKHQKQRYDTTTISFCCTDENKLRVTFHHIDKSRSEEVKWNNSINITFVKSCSSMLLTYKLQESNLLQEYVLHNCIINHVDMIKRLKEGTTNFECQLMSAIIKSGLEYECTKHSCVVYLTSDVNMSEQIDAFIASIDSEYLVEIRSGAEVTINGTLIRFAVV